MLGIEILLQKSMHVSIAARDKREPPKFYRARKAEIAYAIQLRSIANQIGRLIRQMKPETLADARKLHSLMKQYSEKLTPWAINTAIRMLADVMRRDEVAWAELSKGMSRALAKEIKSAPMEIRMQELRDDQVRLIKSLPLDAAERVHHLIVQAKIGGKRANEVAEEIMRSGHVARSRATLIARTETARAATAVVRGRAEFIGATHYRWTSVGDADVRPSHRRLNGKVFSWDNPPLSDPPDYHSHPGEIFNCRCWPTVLVGEEQ
jgi:SPP1 gp7 family putative phage head morphogenesis protein